MGKKGALDGHKRILGLAFIDGVEDFTHGEPITRRDVFGGDLGVFVTKMGTQCRFPQIKLNISRRELTKNFGTRPEPLGEDGDPGFRNDHDGPREMLQSLLKPRRNGNHDAFDFRRRRDVASKNEPGLKKSRLPQPDARHLKDAIGRFLAREL